MAETKERVRRPKARPAQVVIGGIYEHAMLMSGIKIENCRELANIHGARILDLVEELTRSLNGKAGDDGD